MTRHEYFRAARGLVPVTAPLLFLTVFCVFFPAHAGTGAAQADKAAADRAAVAGLAPHKALYEIKLAATKSGSQIVNVNGQMFYEWQPSCDAWISNHRFNLVYEYADAPPMHITSDFSTFETFDGQSMEFISQRKRDRQLFEELRGRAVLGEEGGEAVFTQPPGLSFALPPGAMFPMGHTLNVLQSMRAGKTFYRAVIFDGSDAEGPVEVNAFIGKPVATGAIQKAAAGFDAVLLKSPARRVQLAFFPLKDAAADSDYEMSLVFHENGVISDMTIEYDDFSVTQKLIALEPLEGTCGNGSPKD
jgi:hypothetical protein